MALVTTTADIAGQSDALVTGVGAILSAVSLVSTVCVSGHGFGLMPGDGAIDGVAAFIATVDPRSLISCVASVSGEGSSVAASVCVVDGHSNFCVRPHLFGGLAGSFGLDSGSGLQIGISGLI